MIIEFMVNPVFLPDFYFLQHFTVLLLLLSP